MTAELRDTVERRGHCLCGKVSIRATSASNVGLFEDSAGLAFKGQVFIDEKPEYYEFANKTQNLTGAELFAMFGSS